MRLRGLVIGPFFVCFTLLGLASVTASVEKLAGFEAGGVMFAAASALCFPLLYGFTGFIAGLVLGVLSDLIAGIAGGMKAESKGLVPAKVPY
jgi:hypothetical protein